MPANEGGAHEQNQSGPMVRRTSLHGGCHGSRLFIGASRSGFAAHRLGRPSPADKYGSSIVYVKPGATFGKYDKLAILDCFVQFDKNWQNNYNSNQVDPSTFVASNDMDRIKKELAAEFKRVFTKELQAGGYQVVTTGGSDVLILRPAIINLRVTAPDLMTPGINTTVVSSAGSATLYLELWDSVTNTLLARAMNSQADQEAWAQQANSVTNTHGGRFHPEELGRQSAQASGGRARELGRLNTPLSRRLSGSRRWWVPAPVQRRDRHRCRQSGS